MTPFVCQARFAGPSGQACPRSPDTRTRAFCTATGWADPLTGLPNRAELLGALRAAVRTLDPALGGLAVLYCDLDPKLGNDTLAHPAGVLHLPRDWPWEPAWQQLFTATHAPPPAA